METPAATAAAVAPKLPFWKTIGEAYSATFGNLGTLFGIWKLWLVILLPVYVAYTWFLQPFIKAILATLGTGAPPPSTLVITLVGLVFWLLLLVPLSSMAVTWHRFLLRNEPTASAPAFRFDGVVTRYAGLALAIGLMTQMSGVLSQFAAQMGDPNSTEVGAFGFLASMAGLVAFVVSTRLSVALPGAALETSDGSTFGAAWAGTRRNTLRIFFGSFLCLVPAMAFGLAGFWLGRSIEDRLVYSCVAGALSLLALMSLMVSISFWSYAWRHFFGGQRQG